MGAAFGTASGNAAHRFKERLGKLAESGKTKWASEASKARSSLCSVWPGKSSGNWPVMLALGSASRVNEPPINQPQARSA